MQCNATIYATVNPMQPHMQLATYYATACNGKMINFERKGIVPITFHIKWYEADNADSSGKLASISRSTLCSKMAYKSAVGLASQQPGR